MRRLTTFLVGILIGQLVMFPSLYRLYRTPRIESELVDVRDDYYQTTIPMDFIIKDVPSVFNKKKKYLYIHIRTQPEVVNEYERRFGKVLPGLLGFYDPMQNNSSIHEIYSVNSTSVLTHEMRHLFEGYFHQSLNDIKSNIKHRDDIQFCPTVHN